MGDTGKMHNDRIRRRKGKRKDIFISQMHRIHVSALFFITSCVINLLFSCGLYPRTAMRARLEQASGELLKIEVFLENQDGMALSGARVIVTCPSGTTLLVPFSSQTFSYVQKIESASSGDYVISALSGSPAEEQTMTVPFTALVESPDLNNLSDSAGASALEGDSLQGTLNIAATWDDVPGATVYLFSVIKAGVTCYAQSVPTATCVIPSSTLTAGTYFIRIEAQAIAGDQLLKSENYYSACGRGGTAFIFGIE
jgi:hypothetical protein